MRSERIYNDKQANKGKKWKVAFFTLIGIVLLAIVVIIVLMFSGGDNMTKPTVKAHQGSEVTISVTPSNFETMANKLITEATTSSTMNASLVVDEDVKIKSNVEALGVVIPITLDFDPEIDEHGNILLHQKSVTVGLLDLPAQTALKLMRDTDKLPKWLTVQPSDKTAYIDLSAIDLPIGKSENAHLKAKKFDLKNKEIVLDVIVP